MRPRNLRSGQRLNLYFCMLAPREMPHGKQEQRSRSDEPNIRPRRRESGMRVNGHAPQRGDVQPPVDHEGTPEQLEAQLLMDHIVGIEMDALEDKVVQYVECEERRKQENARIGVFAEKPVVVCGPLQSVERQHRPTDDIEGHFGISPRSDLHRAGRRNIARTPKAVPHSESF